MGPWLEHYALLLLELALVFHSFSASLLPSWVLILFAFQFFWLCNHTSWQLALSWLGFALSRWVGIAGGFVACLGVVAQVLFPIPAIRRSTDVCIGRRSVCLTDETRLNSAFDARDPRKRRVNASLFYPAKWVSGLVLHELFDDFAVVGKALAGVLPAIPNGMRWLFRVVLWHVNGPSSAYKDAPVAAKGKLPLVLVLHGITGPRWQYVTLCERLAESGMLVVAPEHPFDTACSVYSDGEVLYSLGRPPDDDDFEANWTKWNGYLQERVRDTHDVVLPFLKHQTELPIDWDKGVTVIGHSFGAAEALELARQYPKVYEHVICHDLWLYPAAKELRTVCKIGVFVLDADSFFCKGQEVPAVNSLLISSQLWQWKRNLQRIHRLSRKSSHTMKQHFNLVLKRARHHNFHDLAVIAPLVAQWLGMCGHGNAREMLEAVNETTLAFIRLCVWNDTSKDDVLAKVSGHYFECVVPMSHVFDQDSEDHFNESEK